MPDTLPLQRPSSRPLSSGTWLLRVGLLLGLLFGVLVPLRAQLLPNNWRLEFTNKLGQPDPSCTSQACVQVHQDFLSRLVRVCLFRPVPGSMRQWAAVVNPKDLDLCQEVFLADPNTKTMYLHAPYAVGEGTAIPGMMHIACPDQGSCGGPNQPSCGGSRFKPRSSPDMCNSVFFTPYSEKPGYRILQTRMVQMALSMSNFAPVVAQHLQAKAMMSPEQVMAAYRLAFENAKTL